MAFALNEYGFCLGRDILLRLEAYKRSCDHALSLNGSAKVSFVFVRHTSPFQSATQRRAELLLNALNGVLHADVDKKWGILRGADWRGRLHVQKAHPMARTQEQLQSRSTTVFETLIR